MAEENFITDIDTMLKQLLEDSNNITLNGQSVPVKIVTPDPDFEELVLPCITIGLADLKEDLERTCHDREVTKDINTMSAEVKKATTPYSLYYTISCHTDKTRDSRLLFGNLFRFFTEGKALATMVFKNEIVLKREVGFINTSKARNNVNALDVVVRLRVPAEEAEQVPLVQEKRIKAVTN